MQAVCKENQELRVRRAKVDGVTQDCATRTEDKRRHSCPIPAANEEGPRGRDPIHARPN